MQPALSWNTRLALTSACVRSSCFRDFSYVHSLQKVVFYSPIMEIVARMLGVCQVESPTRGESSHSSTRAIIQPRTNRAHFYRYRPLVLRSGLSNFVGWIGLILTATFYSALFVVLPIFHVQQRCVFRTTILPIAVQYFIRKFIRGGVWFGWGKIPCMVQAVRWVRDWELVNVTPGSYVDKNAAAMPFLFVFLRLKCNMRLPVEKTSAFWRKITRRRGVTEYS